jgi:molybdopterin converting factor small subunit
VCEHLQIASLEAEVAAKLVGDARGEEEEEEDTNIREGDVVMIFKIFNHHPRG